MDHCRSLDSNGWALFVCGAENAAIRNFTMINPAGINDKGAVGCSGEELPVNSTVRAGVFNSTIDLTASGDRPGTLLYALNNRNVTYSGRIYSSAALPVQIEGGEAGDPVLADLEVLPAKSPLLPGP